PQPEVAAQRRSEVQPPPLLQRRSGRVVAGAAAALVVAAAIIVPLATRSSPRAKPLRIVPDSLVRIDPRSGDLQAVIQLHVPGAGQMAFVPGGKLWLLGGNSLAWVVDPATNAARALSGGGKLGVGVCYAFESVWVTGGRTVSRVDPETF